MGSLSLSLSLSLCSLCEIMVITKRSRDIWSIHDMRSHRPLPGWPEHLAQEGSDDDLLACLSAGSKKSSMLSLSLSLSLSLQSLRDNGNYEESQRHLVDSRYA